MGHAGAIVSGNVGTAKGKIAALEAAGVIVAQNPTEAAARMVEVVRDLLVSDAGRTHRTSSDSRPRARRASSPPRPLGRSRRSTSSPRRTSRRSPCSRRRARCCRTSTRTAIPGDRHYDGCEYVDDDRAARHRPAEGALRRRARERPAVLGLVGERRRCCTPWRRPATRSSASTSTRAATRRSTRRSTLRRALLSRRLLRRCRARPAHRHGRGDDDRQGAPPEGHLRRLARATRG